MKNILMRIAYLGLAIGIFVIFIASCVITVSDGQGAFVFIFSLPLLIVLLGALLILGRKLQSTKPGTLSWVLIPKALSVFFTLFFVFSFIPFLNQIPHAFLGFVAKGFVSVTGSTPYAYFKERNSFPKKLSAAIEKANGTPISLANLDVSFAWDRVCIFEPYTDQNRAKSVLKLDWNIEEHSQIHYSDSIHALVFLFEGKVNHVIDLKRGIAQFKETNLCLDRAQTQYKIELSASGQRTLVLTQ